MFAIEYGGEDELWRADARCRDGAASLTPLFFSESLDDNARAKAFCAGCVVREDCLASAVARREPWGVWGGELLVNGKVIVNKRKRGRPPKRVRPEDVLPTTWELPIAEIA
ncbi:MAG: WhiB family transcriptional regulator [Acidimicrobiia bacterium]